MLSLYASQQLSVTDDKLTREYTFFKDDKDQDLFYVLPNNPTFIMDNGKPRFRFIKYRGDVSEAKGGFCVFSVSLDYSELESNPALKTQAVKKLLSPDSPIVKVMKQRAEDTLQMCVATTDNNDQVNYEALRKKLGYSPTEADALVQDYKSGKKTTAKDFEVLPDENSIRFSPVTFASSQAELNIQQMNGPLVQNVINPASPNLLGNHSTVFTVELTEQGATLFEQAMKEGQAGIVAVTYSPKFEARLPPATVTVTYASTNTEKFTRDVSRDTWGSQDKIDKKREIFLHDNSNVNVDMGSILGMGADEAAKLRTRLEEWGNKQLQDLLNSKLTIDTTTLTEGQDQVDHFSNQLSAVNDFTRIWSESTSIVYATNLSMQLPTIKSILAPGDSLDNYFQEINTLDPFFQDQEVQVSVNTDYESLGIFSCEVKLYYGSGIAGIKQDIETGKIKKDESGALKDFDPTRYNFAVKAIAFNKDGEVISDKIAWPKEKDQNGNGINTYIYSYEINYKGSTIHYESPCYYTDSPVLTLSVVDEVLQVEADGRNFVNWAIVQSVRFDFEYEDQAQNVSTQRYFYQLSSDDKVAFEPKPIGAKRLQDVKYKSTFYLKNGREITVPQTGLTSVNPNQTGKIVIPIDDPFSGMKKYTFIPKMGAIIDFIGITANYAITALNFQMAQDFTFTKEENKTWHVPVVLDSSDANLGHVTYKGKMRDQGQMKDISGDDGNSNFVAIGPGNIRVVQFSPTKIDFTKYDAVSLYVKYKDETGSYDFTAANEPAYKFSAVLDKPGDKFQYRLELISSGDTIYIPGTTTNDWTDADKTDVKLFRDIKKHT